MKQTSRKLLRELADKNTKASLLALWADLKTLSEEQFVGEIDGIFGEKNATVPTPKSSKKSVNADQNFKSDDRPVTRIAFVLEEEKNLSAPDARRLLVQELLAQGYDEDDIPSPNSKSLEEWLEMLLLHIPSSDVMDAAKKLR